MKEIKFFWQLANHKIRLEAKRELAVKLVIAETIFIFL